MASVQDIFLKAKQNDELQKPNFQKAYTLVQRLLKIKSIEGSDATFFESHFGYSEQLIFQLPTFALNVLEKVSNDDICWAVLTVLVLTTHCPRCNCDINSSMTICPKCKTTLPKGAIVFEGYDWVPISNETRKLLRSISVKTDNAVKIRKDFSNPKKEKFTKENLNCPDCGMEIPPNSNYCWNCGSKIEQQPVEYHIDDDQQHIEYYLDDYIFVSMPLSNSAYKKLKKKINKPAR